MKFVPKNFFVSKGKMQKERIKRSQRSILVFLIKKDEVFYLAVHALARHITFEWSKFLKIS